MVPFYPQGYGAVTLQVIAWSWAGLHAVMLRTKPWNEWERQKWKVTRELSNLDNLTSAFLFVLRGTS